ncbi:MAG TPA: hypothetical protein VG755_30365 [Nannocystaceae bacterium]|nr:hypothetical protein [Nannocystaceae bacterium]
MALLWRGPAPEPVSPEPPIGEPAPSEPVNEPLPSEPLPSEPLPSEPSPSEPVPSEPVPSEPAPTEPVSEPKPAEPKPAEPKPVEPAPVDASTSAAFDDSRKRRGLRRHRFVYKNLTALRYNPLGLVNEFQFGWRVQLIDKNTTLFKDSYFALKAHTFLNPAFGRVGPMLELQPLAILNLQAIYNAVGYFKTFDQLQSFQSPNASYSDTDLDKRTNRRYPGLGHYVTLAALVQAKVGRFAVRDNIKFYYAYFHLMRDPVTHRQDTVYYDQTLDILQPNKGWVATNDLDAIYLFDFGLKLGARYTLTHAFYTNGMYPAGESTANRNSPTHRVGPAILYSPPKWHKKAAKRTKLSRKRWYNPTAILLVQWWVQHRWRTGEDVSAGIPYFVLGFAFEGDFWP